MSFMKSIINAINSMDFSATNTLVSLKQNISSNEASDERNEDAERIINATSQFIENAIAISKNNTAWNVFSQHYEAMVLCLKRYEEAKLRELEALQKEQATTLLEALQKGEDLVEKTDHSAPLDIDRYVKGLKKVTLFYCQKHIKSMSMSDFMDDIPDKLCDGKRVSTFSQSRKNGAIKDRWNKFDKICRDEMLYLSPGMVFFETSIWGSGKQGIMLGVSDIGCIGGSPEKFRVPWSHVTSLWHSKGYLYVNDYKTGLVSGNGAEELLELLEEHFNKMKNSDGNKLLSCLGYGPTVQKEIEQGYDEDVGVFVESKHMGTLVVLHK